jgi:hypothetical protein
MKLITALILSVTAMTAQAEVQVPNLPHSTKMFMVASTATPEGTMAGMFRVTGWKNGVDTFTVAEARCGTNTIRDVAFGEGKESNINVYPQNMRNYYVIVGDGNQGSISYNRYRALCGLTR